MNFAKFLRTPFLIEHLQWLLPKVELDLSNYEAKADLKGATGIDSSTLTTKQIWGA